MCSGTRNTKMHWSSPDVFIRQRQHHQRQNKKAPHVLAITLWRKRLKLISRRAAGAGMAMLNLKLHLENRHIMVENERLRERAGMLRRENLALRANLSKTVTTVPPPPAEVAPGC